MCLCICVYIYIGIYVYRYVGFLNILYNCSFQTANYLQNMNYKILISFPSVGLSRTCQKADLEIAPVHCSKRAAART